MLAGEDAGDWPRTDPHSRPSIDLQIARLHLRDRISSSRPIRAFDRTQARFSVPIPVEPSAYLRLARSRQLDGICPVSESAVTGRDLQMLITIAHIPTQPRLDWNHPNVRETMPNSRSSAAERSGAGWNAQLGRWSRVRWLCISCPAYPDQCGAHEYVASYPARPEVR